MSNTDATPGGGSAAAITGSIGCGLGQMAVGITLKSKKLDESKRDGLQRAHLTLGEMRAHFDALAREDAAAFDHFMAMMALPKEDPTRSQRMQHALKGAAEAPLKIAQTAAGALAVTQAAAPSAGAAVASDINCALHLLKAAALCAAENVRINIASIKDPGVAKDLEERLLKTLATCSL
jgi:formiminotetrahydrofolate cyclodeaminase